MKNPVKLVSCDLRDGQQACIATRMTTQEMLPVLQPLDHFGFAALEVWGGATFDACIRFLNEDPWDRLKTIKKYCTRTPLRMLLRGQNLLGYAPYPDDIVDKFVTKAAEDGIDIFLIFDGLNDVRNVRRAAEAALKAGKKVEANIQFTSSPVHTIESFVKTAQDYVDVGATALHLEDMGGMITPRAAAATVKALKENFDLPVHYHAHCTGGMTDVTYWEVIRAGADVVDVDTAAFALGTGQPCAESMIAMLQGTERDTGLDYTKLTPISDYLKLVRASHPKYETKLKGVDINVVRHQIPGGMRSNLESQLADMKALDKLPQVLEEVVNVRRDLGYPPLGTPFSQMCGAQATMNVMSGERYKVIMKEIKDYVMGKYGKAPGPVSETLKKMILKDGQQPLTCRPADLIPPGWDKAVAESRAFARSEEDVLTYALFPQVGKEFLQKKYHIRS
ncbi:MAG: pyruvate carboxylase subunit B [Acidaminococcus sp.]|jgi:pyruvate carboxylase subunit B|nr:pyruvate carboxylase subunit B [Acidaminococcus sp.]MCI2115402.1 pyruvate carboxylase subunit B [Acidaminococcus sp.]MCI2117494.1 pyruvate carboxylase subunit B [Acidaminococcus sp.]